ncbi:MAG: hypothetical protein J6386_08020 [Candidatus Synoicihabitans palmerolidicus]|nr:hypothetical protein [Candidatus Synoicihabitans palmerolidicus]
MPAFEVINRRQEPVSAGLHRLTHSTPLAWRRLARRFTPTSLRLVLKERITRLNSRPAQGQTMPPDCRRQLLSGLEAEIAYVEKRLARPLPNWRC